MGGEMIGLIMMVGGSAMVVGLLVGRRKRVISSAPANRQHITRIPDPRPAGTVEVYHPDAFDKAFGRLNHTVEAEIIPPMKAFRGGRIGMQVLAPPAIPISKGSIINTRV